MAYSQEKEDSRRFANSYRPIVPLGGNKSCSLKRHFYGVLHEVVGYLDLLASKHPDLRFAYPGVGDILDHCRRFDSKNKYSKAAVEKALAYLRARHVISARLVRFCDGQLRDGFIVAPHEHLTICTSATRCRFVGMAAPFDCWHQLPTGEVFWVNPNEPDRHRQPELKIENVDAEDE
ncbi:MAG: hypothetical protein LAO20_21435 [Acidobacteriia bacterium]|nr:hypothetical protein [Terriglobia bacterium]